MVEINIMCWKFNITIKFELPEGRRGHPEAPNIKCWIQLAMYLLKG
jgi:hypothetical protein